MPVEDHAVSDKVRIQSDTPYGCNSRTGFSKGYYAPDRVHKPDGTFYIIQRLIEHEMSAACRSFYLWEADPRCRGCTSERDEEYAERMKELE